MGKHCNLPDEVITDVIISTINNNIIRASAHAANCKSTEKLLLFLSDYNYVTQTHKHHSSGLNFKSQRFTKNDQHRSQNKFISKPFNNKDTNYSTVTNKRNITCSYCKKDGHTREMCFKLKARKENSQPAQVQQISKDDAKYHINAKINNQTVTAYVDFGSACNLIKLEKAQELQLTIDKERAITIRGYGGALVPTLGLIQANVNVDSVTRSVPVYAVKNHHQEVDLLIGRPFTESSNTYVIKSADTLTFYEEAEFELLSSFHVEEICNKLAIHAEENTTVVPGINKIAVRTNLNQGIVVPNFSEQQHNSSALIVPSKPIEFHNCLGILTVYSISYANTLLRKGQCVARGIPSGQSQTEVPVRPSLLTEAQQTRLDKLLKDYDDCFAASTSELGNTNVEMRIKLTSTVPVCYKPYRLSFYEREVVRKIVADLMENNIIEPTVSEYASPILLVKKKSGEIRMVVDYRKLNSITEKDHYPLPNIEDQLERLAGHTCFTTLDMASGYHQFRVAEDSKPFIAFVTPDGHYQYKRVPFGLTNAPAVFQRAINEILGPLRFSYALAYLDDILIISKGIDQGLERLEVVLKTFKSAGLTLNKRKCLFLQGEVEYLGSVISEGQVKPSPQKIKAVRNFPTLQNVHDVRKFLGLASYFRKYVKDFARKAKPLTILTKASTPWTWSQTEQGAFDLLKKELGEEPVLALFDPKLETQLHTDASKDGFGAILLQKQLNGAWKPVQYMSQQTSSCESGYHSYELETLAIVVAVRKFRNYLYGRRFTIVTDCNALRLTWTKRDLTPRIGRWWIELQEYDFDVNYRPGTQMKHVDALSRKPPVISLIKESDWLQCVQNMDDECGRIKNEIENGLSKDYRIVEGKICRVVNNENKLLIPKDVRWRIVRQYHDENGHPGFKRTYESISKNYWFAKMKRFVTKYINACIPCLCAKKPTGKRRGYLHPIPKVEQPFHTLHLDHLGPFCRTANDNVYVLVTVDAFTKFTWLEAVKDTSTKPIIQCLKLLMKFYGNPNRIITDRGKGFTSKEMSNFTKSENIKHVLNAIASPRSNGQVERFNSTIQVRNRLSNA
jgi:hypothetical protein